MRENNSTERYPKEMRELAYQLWAFRASQNFRRTTRLLVSEEFGSWPEVSDETIRYWSKTENWPDRIVADARAIAPGLHVKAVVDQLAGGPEAIAFLRQVVAGEIEADTKTRVTAALGLADRSGYSPLGRTTTPRLAGAGSAAKQLTAMTPEEATAYERQLIDGEM